MSNVIRPVLKPSRFEVRLSEDDLGSSFAADRVHTILSVFDLTGSKPVVEEKGIWPGRTATAGEDTEGSVDVIPLARGAAVVARLDGRVSLDLLLQRRSSGCASLNPWSQGPMPEAARRAPARGA